MRLVTVVVEPLSGVKPILANAEEMRGRLADHHQIARGHQRNAAARDVALHGNDGPARACEPSARWRHAGPAVHDLMVTGNAAPHDCQRRQIAADH